MKMTKTKKNIISTVLCAVMLILALCTFASCKNSDLSVTFSVEGKTQTVEVTDGKVTLPSDPEKEFYEFRGWYTTSTFDEGTEFTKDSEVTKSLTVYAYFAPIRVSVSVNGSEPTSIKLEDLAAKTTEHITTALGENLTFDGWYIDSGYTTKYTSQDTDDLYGRYMAEVRFDNGYETVYTALVQKGSSIAKPDSSSVAKNYMDTEDLSFVDANGNEFDFKSEIKVNTVVTVKWKSPYLVYEKIDGTANYAVIGFDSDHAEEVLQYPCISVLSKNVTTTDKSGNTLTINVVSVKAGSSSTKTTRFSGCIDGAKKIIFADGIEYIVSLNGDNNTLVEEIVFPKTLKVLEKSIWCLDQLKGIELPDGIEVIVDCFWKHYMSSTVGLYRGKYDYDFDIVIPNSVKSLAMVPANVKFEEGSKYFAENNCIYKKDGNDKILVSITQSSVVDGKVNIPEGTTKIHVGILNKFFDCDYIYLPSTLTGVEYTADSANYNTFYDGRFLTAHQYISSPGSGNMDADAYCLLNTLDNLEYVVFNTSEYPFGSNYYLFIGLLNGNYVTFDKINTTKLVFTAKVESGADIKINVSYTNTMVNGSKKNNTVTAVSGSNLDKDQLLKQLGITSEDIGAKIKVTSITQFGEDYKFGAKDCNQYIEITFEYDVEGFTYTENTDGTITVTGFNSSTAQLLANGTYLVVIPDSVNGKLITAIADGAFKGNNAISKVYIGKNVKRIGAEAFMNTSNIEYLSVASGGLEEIGRSAFENLGSINDNGTWKINPDMPQYKFTNYTAQTAYIYIPLANLKSVEPYAFKSIAIAAFMPVEGEEDRILMKFAYGEDPMNRNAVVGQFYYLIDSSSDKVGLIQYMGQETVQQVSCIDSSKNADVVVWDVRLVAVVSGAKADETLSLGFSLRPFAAYMGNDADLNVLRYEVMEGSVYYRRKVSFGIVSKIHKNAFTDMGMTLYSSTGEVTLELYDRSGDNVWLTKDDIVGQNSEIFEDGWWLGIPNSENTAVSEDKIGSSTRLLT